MQLRTSIIHLLIYAIYPAWLIAGAVDYACHRRTRIERTSGTAESEFHIAQFCTIVILVGGAALLRWSWLVLSLLGIVVILHTVLAYLDVRYTQARRYISPMEQHAHAFMDVLPIVTVALLIPLAIDQAETIPWHSVELRESPRWPSLGIFVSLIVLGGTPILEEWLRTLRTRRKTVSAMIAMR